jgi:hypothetical protein
MGLRDKITGMGRSPVLWFLVMIGAMAGMAWSLTVTTGDHFWAWPPFAALFLYSLYRLAALRVR